MSKRKENIFIILATVILSFAFYITFNNFLLSHIFGNQYLNLGSVYENYSSSTDSNVLPPENPTNYKDNKDGTITDNYTKLTWIKCPQGLSGNNCQNGAVTFRNFAKSRTECEDLSFAGKIGWRMPTIKELESIVDTSSNRNMINEDYFFGTEDPFWSATSPSVNTTSSYIVIFSNGTVYLQENNNVAALRCVHD